MSREHLTGGRGRPAETPAYSHGGNSSYHNNTPQDRASLDLSSPQTNSDRLPGRDSLAHGLQATSLAYAMPPPPQRADLRDPNYGPPVEAPSIASIPPAHSGYVRPQNGYRNSSETQSYGERQRAPNLALFRDLPSHDPQTGRQILYDAFANPVAYGPPPQWTAHRQQATTLRSAGLPEHAMPDVNDDADSLFGLPAPAHSRIRKRRRSPEVAGEEVADEEVAAQPPTAKRSRKKGVPAGTESAPVARAQPRRSALQATTSTLARASATTSKLARAPSPYDASDASPDEPSTPLLPAIIPIAASAAAAAAPPVATFPARLIAPMNQSLAQLTSTMHAVAAAGQALNTYTNMYRALGQPDSQNVFPREIRDFMAQSETTQAVVNLVRFVGEGHAMLSSARWADLPLITEDDEFMNAPLITDDDEFMNAPLITDDGEFMNAPLLTEDEEFMNAPLITDDDEYMKLPLVS